MIAAVGAAGAAVLAGVLLLLIRAILGPTVYDRILAVNAMGTKTVIFVAVLGFLVGRPEFLDIGLVYAVVNFVATISLLKFIEHRRLD